MSRQRAGLALATALVVLLGGMMSACGRSPDTAPTNPTVTSGGTASTGPSASAASGTTPTGHAPSTGPASSPGFPFPTGESGTPASSGPSSASASGPASASSSTTGGTVAADSQAVTAWATESGAVTCVLQATPSEPDETMVRCDVLGASYTEPAKPGSCALSWGGSVGIVDGDPQFLCVGDHNYPAASVGAPGTWWHAQGDPTATSPETAGAPLAVLAPGREVHRGQITCSTTRTSVTCTDAQSDHGFTVAPSSYTFK